ncbi:D-alanyl-D-alanine carboxypeptidase family protein [Aquibacillus salsiterrae]|uniref:D-alanyl-D-alanine carboxypeptidase n=1 Tax=Aquibacillus salsiterrae TaxID=2950439 RepID=A0A9X4AE80_9BACI|nr:D-alanyl-D-alanine carboxypeptidase family protein [Aquibacillus salsiterrae]MDC3416199.1 D-alanyl-D-alanine carboxypeptidase [Aquibacillus salsiterrae]
MRVQIIFLTICFMFIAILIPPSALAEEETTPSNLLTESVILLDAKSEQVLYEKNSEKSMYPASLTKIATAIYAIETGNLNDIVTVSKKARQVEGTRVYLEEGEQVTLLKLVKGLLINSGNDAGIAIAEHIDGNLDKFEVSINDYLKNKVGLENTYFTNPHGLYDPKHQTTAYDLAKLTQYAMKNDLFREIIGTKEMKWIGKGWKTTLYHHHKLMREMPYEGITGGKTGFVDQSGYTLMTTAERDNLSLIVISMNGIQPMDTYNDTIQLLDYGFLTFGTKLIARGSEYKNDTGDTYTLADNQYVTTYKDKDMITKLSEDGTLIVNEGDALLKAEIPLQQEVKESTVVNVSEEEKPENEQTVEGKSSSNYSVNSFLLFIFLIIIICSSFIIKRKKNA